MPLMSMVGVVLDGLFESGVTMKVRKNPGENVYEIQLTDGKRMVVCELRPVAVFDVPPDAEEAVDLHVRPEQYGDRGGG